MSLRAQRHLEHWVVLAASLVLVVWYANPQLIYSLRFAYEVARFLFPGLIPNFRGA